MLKSCVNLVTIPHKQHSGPGGYLEHVEWRIEIVVVRRAAHDLPRVPTDWFRSKCWATWQSGWHVCGPNSRDSYPTAFRLSPAITALSDDEIFLRSPES